MARRGSEDVNSVINILCSRQFTSKNPKKGALKCAGSTAFLKQQLGDGYHLTLSLKEDANIDHVTEFVKSKAEEAEMATLIGNEAEFILPFSSASKFPELFRSLDSKETGVESYGASITTMDEIFLKVTKDDGAGKEDEGPEEIDEASDEEILQELAKSVQLLEGRQLFMQQFRGAFIKCFLHAIRNWKIILLQLLLPTIMTVFAVVQILSIPEIGAQDCFQIIHYIEKRAPYKIGKIKFYES